MIELVTLVVITLVVQQALETVKKTIKIKKGYSLFKVINVKMLLSVILSVAICVSSQIGILALLGVNLVLPLVDYIMTGLIVAGGASGVRELQKQIQEAKNVNKE